MALSGYCRGGMFSVADRASRKAALDDNKRAVDEALALGAPCLVLVVGGLPKDSDGRIVSKDMAGAREIVRDGVGELLEYARPAAMPLAIEPLHPMYAADRACINTMAHANDLCDELAPGANGGLGIAVDVYHVWWDPDLRAEIERAGGHPGRLVAFHWMENAGYRGPHEVEIFSANNWWKRDPDEVLRTCIERHRTVC